MRRAPGSVHDHSILWDFASIEGQHHMGCLSILHIDDETDIREVVRQSLGLDPEFNIRGSACGKDGLSAAVEDMPDLILLDVMMPILDGPATLARLRTNPLTSMIPVIFLTARAHSRDVEHFKSLGAIGVIAKPFDPMTLAAVLRSYVEPGADILAPSRDAFLRRVNSDSAAVLECWLSIVGESASPSVLHRIRSIAQGLAGASAIFGHPRTSDASAALEAAATGELYGANGRRALDQAVKRFLTGIMMDLEAQIGLSRKNFDA
jgi:CheY-like chemotaxis protein